MPLIEKQKTEPGITNGNSTVNGDDDLVENDDFPQPKSTKKQVQHIEVFIY